MRDDGRLCWRQTLGNPATAPPAAVTSIGAGTAGATAASNVASYQPPSLVPSAPANGAINDGGEARRFRRARSVPAAAASAAANAAAVFRYWTSSRSQRSPSATSALEGGSHFTVAVDQSSAERGEAGRGLGRADVEVETIEADSMLSDAERGEGSSTRGEHAESGAARVTLKGAVSSMDSVGGSADGDSDGSGFPKDKGLGSGTSVMTTDAVTLTRRDSFGDEVMMTKSPGYYTT